LARRRNAGVQRRRAGRANQNDSIRKSEERRSMMLRTSPVRMNKPLRNNKPEQNRTSCVYGVIPNISVRKTSEAMRSTVPSILTNTMHILFILGLRSFLGKRYFGSFRMGKIYIGHVILRNMEIVARISKGSKMDQVYIPKNRIGFSIGNYVILKPIGGEKQSDRLFYYGVKDIGSLKLGIIQQVIGIIDKHYASYGNVIFTGSFLDEGFQFNDIDIIVVSEKNQEKITEKEIKEKLGIEAHAIPFNKISFREALEIDPIWRLMLSRCVAKNRLAPLPKKRLKYRYLDAQMIRSKMLADNFDNLTGRERYKLMRNLMVIYLFINNKKLSAVNIEKEIKAKFRVSISDIERNLIDDGFFKRYNEFYDQLEEEVIDNAGKQEKAN